MSKYSDAEKAAYWKKRALQDEGGGRPVRQKEVAYKKKANRTRDPAYYAYKERRQMQAARKDPGIISSMGGVLGGLAGTALGGPVGGPIGGFLGGKLGHLVEKITGFGDYTVKQNSLMGGGMNSAQIVNSTISGGTIVRHREYIGEVSPTEAFTITKYPINPGQKKTFPWLADSGGGAGYEQYRMRGMIFEFVSTSSDSILSSGSSTGLGSVIMATDYDALDAPYPNKRAMLNSEYASSAKPSCSFIHPIECKNSLTPAHMQYVRTGESFPTGGDPRWYDLGNFYIATEGMQVTDSSSIGELHAIYELELFKPQISELEDEEALTDMFGITDQVAAEWLKNPVASAFNTLGGTCDSATYYFPTGQEDGEFLITYWCQGDAVTCGQVLPILNHVDFIDTWIGAGTNFLQAPPGGTTGATYLMCQFVVKLNAANASVGFSTITIPTGGSSPIAVLTVTQIASTFGPQ